MRLLKILHTSDIHLDHVLTDYGRDCRNVRRAELVSAFDFLVDEAVRQAADIMLIAGDLLSARSISDSTASAVREGFRRLAQASIFAAVVPGEAEEVHSLAMLRQVCSEPNVHLFSGEEWSRVSPLAGVSVWGLRTTSRNSTTNALGNLVIEGPGIHIGLMHSTFAGTPGLDSSISPIVPAELSQSGLDYLALGHYHNMVNNSVGRATCWYSGSPVHLGFDTRGERHALIVTVREDGVRVYPMKVPGRPHRVVNIEVSAARAREQLYARLARLAGSELCLRAEIEGEVGPDDAGLAGQAEQDFRSRFFHLTVADHTTVSYPPWRSSDSRSRHLDEAFFREAARLAAESGAPRRLPGVIDRALKLGLGALGEVDTLARRETVVQGQGQAAGDRR
ncbi:MAG: metallophosphoesterase family protein [Bacillota bacterium]|nr:DNA repair exonuclease [Bacillota bacterium]